MKKRIIVCVLSLLCMVMLGGASQPFYEKITLSEMSLSEFEGKGFVSAQIIDFQGTGKYCYTKQGFSVELNEDNGGKNLEEGIVVILDEGSTCLLDFCGPSWDREYALVTGSTSFAVVKPKHEHWMCNLMGMLQFDIIEKGTGRFYYGEGWENIGDGSFGGVRG